MPLPWVALVVTLAAVGGVITARLLVPWAVGAVDALAAATVHAEPIEARGNIGEGADAEADDDALVGDHVGPEAVVESEIPVGDEEVPEPEDPEDAVERAPAAEPDQPRPVPANPPPRLESVEVELIEGDRPWVVHRLTPQESIDQVAYRYDATPEVVLRWNGLSPQARRLQRGSRLKLKARRIPPPRQKLEYTVQPGDTWWSIAVAHAIDSKELRAANWHASRRLTVGDTLTLWIDPAVYHWVQTDRPALEDEDLLSNIRRGAVGVGPPWAGRLINGVQIPAGEGWRRKMLPSSYGTTHAVVNLVAALQQFHRDSGYPYDLMLGSMSRRHGGPLSGHVSHQSGRDVDIRLPISAEHPPWQAIEPKRVDYVALWKLVLALMDTGEVSIMFLDYALQQRLHDAVAELGVDEDTRRRMIQYPRGNLAHGGLVRHSSGHEAHIHVRFRCGPHETECVKGQGWTRGG